MIKFYCDGCGKEKTSDDLTSLLWNGFDVRTQDRYGNFCVDCRKKITKTLIPILKGLKL
jgi:hypothetical protein